MQNKGNQKIIQKLEDHNQKKLARMRKVSEILKDDLDILFVIYGDEVQETISEDQLSTLINDIRKYL